VRGAAPALRDGRARARVRARAAEIPRADRRLLHARECFDARGMGASSLGTQSRDLGADAAMSTRASGLARLAPGGSPIPLRALRRLFARGDAEGELRDGLAKLLGVAHVTLHGSGREAMRVAFRALAERSGRCEVALPAYVCFSVPAAAVAAGLSV